MTEVQLWSKLKPHLEGYGYAQKMETVKGIPDVLGICYGYPYLMELKVSPWPKRPTTMWRVKTTPQQRRHLSRYQRGGGLGLILVAIPNTGQWYLMTSNTPTEMEWEDVTRFRIAHGKLDKLGDVPVAILNYAALISGAPRDTPVLDTVIGGE